VAGDGTGEAAPSTTTMDPGAAGAAAIVRPTFGIVHDRSCGVIVLDMEATGAIVRPTTGRQAPSIGPALFALETVPAVPATIALELHQAVVRDTPLAIVPDTPLAIALDLHQAPAPDTPRAIVQDLHQGIGLAM
jgi:hypothetical protein